MEMQNGGTCIGEVHSAADSIRVQVNRRLQGWMVAWGQHMVEGPAAAALPAQVLRVATVPVVLLMGVLVVWVWVLSYS